MNDLRRIRSRDELPVKNNLRNYRDMIARDSPLQKVDSHRILMEHYKKINPSNHGYPSSVRNPSTLE